MLDGANGFLSQACIRLTNFASDQDLGPSHTIPRGLILSFDSRPIQAEERVPGFTLNVSIYLDFFF